MRTAFAAYARDHEAATIRHCWSTWNVLRTFLYTSEQVAANPMKLVGRPKLARPLPRTAIEALLETAAQGRDSRRAKKIGLKEISRSSSPYSWSCLGGRQLGH
jgi:integrase/recombinase XerC